MPLDSTPSRRARDYLNQAASRGSVAVLSLLLGFGYAYHVVGGHVLNPLDLSWLSEDPATSYLGWAFFRQEPRVGFPIGWSNAIGYPLGEPIAYLDSMPLLAFVCWLFRAALPAEFQYLGLWFAVCCCLQFYFGYRLSRRLSGGSASAVLGGLLFLISPVFTWRAFGHFALVSQWFILAALELLLASGKGLTKGSIIRSSLLCLTAACINPYIAFMTLLTCCAAHLRSVFSGTCRLAPAAAVVVMNGVLVVAGFLVFGFLIGSDSSLYTGTQYEATSMNLLSPIDPQLWGSLLLKMQPLSNSLQFEGYNYLGLGVIALGIVSVARSPGVLKLLANRSCISVVGVFLVSLLLALSTRGTVGAHTLYNLHPPRLVIIGLQSLRASGRLFWPAYYLLLTGIIAAAVRTTPRRWLPVLLAATVVVQFLDLRGLRDDIRHTWATSSVPALTDPAWRVLGQQHRHLVVLPPYQCSPSDTPVGPKGYATFGLLAVQQHMTINSFYAGRYSKAQLSFYCARQLQELERDGMQAGTAYVFPANRSSLVASLDTAGHYCRVVDGQTLCSQVPGQAGVDQSVINQVPALPRGTVVLYQAENSLAKSILRNGWSVPEAWGIWSIGPASGLSFRVVEPERPISVTLVVRPFLLPGRRQRIELKVNGVSLSRWDLTTAGDQALTVEIPPGLMGVDGIVRMELLHPDAVEPKTGGFGDDARQIAVGLLRMQIGA